MRRAAAGLALLLAAGAAGSQDFPVDPPGGEDAPPPPIGLALPEDFLAPPSDLVTPLAILDRLVHNAHRLELDGPSLRRASAPTENVDEGHGA